MTDIHQSTYPSTVSHYTQLESLIGTLIEFSQLNKDANLFKMQLFFDMYFSNVVTTAKSAKESYKTLLDSYNLYNPNEDASLQQLSSHFSQFNNDFISLKSEIAYLINFIIQDQTTFSIYSKSNFVYDYSDQCFLFHGTYDQCSEYINHSSGNLSILGLESIRNSKHSLFISFVEYFLNYSKTITFTPLTFTPLT
jgi:hypothetical protein